MTAPAALASMVVTPAIQPSGQTIEGCSAALAERRPESFWITVRTISARTTHPISGPNTRSEIRGIKSQPDTTPTTAGGSNFFKCRQTVNFWKLRTAKTSATIRRGRTAPVDSFAGNTWAMRRTASIPTPPKPVLLSPMQIAAP